MLENLKSKWNDPKYDYAKEIAKNVAAGVVLGVAVKAGTYIIVKGTQALVEEIRNRNTEESAE